MSIPMVPTIPTVKSQYCCIPNEQDIDDFMKIYAVVHDKRITQEEARSMGTTLLLLIQSILEQPQSPRLPQNSNSDTMNTDNPT